MVSVWQKGYRETPMNEMEKGDRVRVIKGYADPGFGTLHTLDGGLEWPTPKGSLVIFKALVEK